MSSSFFNAGVYAAASAITVFAVFAWKITAISLFGLHAYLLPDDPAHGNAAARAVTDENLRKSSRKKSTKEKFVWNDGGSEILRITIGDSYLENSRYYSEYDQAVLYSALAVSLLVSREFLSFQSSVCEQGEDSRSSSADLIPVIVTTFCILKLLHNLCKVSWDKHSSRNSEWVLSCAVGFVGFMLATIVIFSLPREILDFGLEQAIAGSGIDKLPLLGSFTIRLAVAIVSGWITGLLLGPVLKSVRCFWLATNQLGWEISVVKTGTWSRILVNLGFVLPPVTALLWFKPMAELFLQDSRANSGRTGSLIRLAGFSPEFLEELKFVGLIVSGLIQLLALRINVQAYLNLGVLAWYESLHGSRSPDTQALKHKILVVNYFLCRVAIQLLVPAAIIVLLAGLSRSASSSCSAPDLDVVSKGFVQNIALLFAWWTLFSWSLLASTILALFRCGLLLAY